jgi:aspartyl-tRNA synthetase
MSQKILLLQTFKKGIMLRTHTCGQLNISNLGETVTLCGWVQKSRDLGGTTFIDVRDRYGLTQLVLNTDTDANLREAGKQLGREFVIKVTGKVLSVLTKTPRYQPAKLKLPLPNWKY